jgi:hypothetical protein
MELLPVYLTLKHLPDYRLTLVMLKEKHVFSVLCLDDNLLTVLH